MPIVSKELRERRKKRIAELLKQGLTPRAIKDRLGVAERQVLRVRQTLRDEGILAKPDALS